MHTKVFQYHNERHLYLSVDSRESHGVFQLPGRSQFGKGTHFGVLDRPLGCY